MIKIFFKSIAILSLFFSSLALSEVEPVKETKDSKVHYKKSKNLSFESHTVEGQIYRPDLSVVTGDTWLQENSILRMRKSWLDKVAIEYGEGNNDFNTK